MNVSPKKAQAGFIPRVAFLIGLMVLSCGVTVGMTRTTSKPTVKSPQRLSGKNAPQVIKTVLSNGLTILVKPTDANEVVALNLLVRSGPLYEKMEQRGISSLTQQVLLRGSAKRSAREIILATEAVGAELSTGLGSGYGYVSLTTTTGGLMPALDVLLDLLQQPSFSATELAKEKKMLGDRLTAREDQPFNAAYLGFMELFYAGHPYGVKTADLVTSVRKLTRDDLVAWYHKTYVPQNMVVSIVGKVDPVVIKRRLTETLGRRPAGKQPSLTVAPLRNQSRDLQGFKQRATQGMFLVLGYPAPALNGRDRTAMEVLNRILGGNGEGRLYAELREKRGLVYTIYSEYEKLNGRAHICVMMATAPRNYKAAREQVVRQVRRLATQPVSARELAMAKQALRGSYLMAHETNNAQSLYLGRYELDGLGYAYDRSFPQLIERVTVADVQRVARKYFTHYTMSVVADQPIK
jgi:zinc protease